MNRRRFLSVSAALSVSAQALVAAGEESPAMREARETALAQLQPSERDLAHGLELHADALVFDAYGFSPRAAVPADQVREAIEGGASEIELQDLREDLAMTRPATDDAERREFEMAWRAAGLTALFQNAGEESQDPLVLIKRLARFTYLTDSIPEVVRRAVSAADVERAKAEGRSCLCFTANGVPLTQAWRSFEDETRYVRIFRQLGVRMMHITYQRRNMLGDGCGEPSDAGLSDFGRAAVGELNRQGVIPDVAHSGRRTSLETARVSARPAVASHSVCAALNDHIRAKPDETIRALAGTGGYMGVCLIPRFLGGTGDIRALVAHLEHIVQLVGPDHAAIGTDVAYTSRYQAAESARTPRPPKFREPFRLLWPADPFLTTPEMTRSLAWTNWPLFTVAMVQRGFSDEAIRKILGGNVVRVLRANE